MLEPDVKFLEFVPTQPTIPPKGLLFCAPMEHYLTKVTNTPSCIMLWYIDLFRDRKQRKGETKYFFVRVNRVNTMIILCKVPTMIPTFFMLFILVFDYHY